MKSNYAIVEISGRQFYIEKNKYYDFNKLSTPLNTTILFNRILLYSTMDFVCIGEPYLKNLNISGKVLNHFKGEKTIVYKMNSKKKTRKKQGHRQNLTRILIDNIGFTNN